MARLYRKAVSFPTIYSPLQAKRGLPLTTKCFMDLHSPTENENPTGERFLTGVRNDNPVISNQVEIFVCSIFKGSHQKHEVSFGALAHPQRASGDESV